eukprot:15203854-Alexandrium_andersonii.AAC.1
MRLSTFASPPRPFPDSASPRLGISATPRLRICATPRLRAVANPLPCGFGESGAPLPAPSL